MKDVVTAARAPVLVTGFGPFPGAPSNPTSDVLRLLAVRGVDGVPLVLAPMPVTFSGIGPALRCAAACRPRAILLLGLARRRLMLCVERVARNRAGSATPDVDGVVPAAPALVAGGPDHYAATWPATAIRDALLTAGHDAVVSDDAGDYVCNAALYHALHDGLASMVGFLHVPPVGCRGATPTVEDLAAAARVAVAVMAGTQASPYHAAASAG